MVSGAIACLKDPPAAYKSLGARAHCQLSQQHAVPEWPS